MNKVIFKDAPQAFFLKERQAQRITPAAGSSGLLPDSLVIPPGNYSVFNQTYNLQEQGLYRFVNAMHENRQRIVYQDNIWALMSAISWITTHGYRDNDLSYEEKYEIAKQGKLVVTCGACSHFSQQLLSQLSIPVRVVQMATLLDRNGYNDGHVLTEVKIKDKWIIFDPDLKSLYLFNRKKLDLFELVLKRKEDYRREQLSNGLSLAIGHLMANGYSYDLWEETCLSNDILLHEIFSRLLGIPIQTENGIHYYTTSNSEDKKRVEMLYPDGGLNHLMPIEFLKKFY